MENEIEDLLNKMADIIYDTSKREKLAYLMEEAYNRGREDQIEDSYDIMAEENINDYLELGRK